MKILQYPDERLRQKSEEIFEINQEIKELAEQLKVVMKENNGLGISAIQVGIPLKLIIVGDKVLINPEILSSSSPRRDKEGCLSFDNGKKFIKVKRATKVKVKYKNLDNEEKEIEFTHDLARCVLHEIDHLNGVLMIDRR